MESLRTYPPPAVSWLAAITLSGVAWLCEASLCAQTSADHTSITSPAMPANRLTTSEYKTGVKLSITGTALNSTFERFQVDWARGFDATNGWNAEGMSLSGGGVRPVTNGVLAIWDTGVVTQAAYVTIRLQVMGAGFTNEARSAIYLEPDLYSTNWPQAVDQGWGGFPSSLQLARDGTGSNYLVLAGANQEFTLPSRLWRFSLDGSFVTDWPLNRSRFGLVAVADLDGKPGDEIVAAELQSVRIFRDNGSSIAAQTLSPDLQFDIALPTLADLDGDGTLEILVTTGGWIYAWHGDGTLFNTNFPIGPMQPSLAHQILPVDSDADGRPELLVVLRGTNWDAPFSLKMFRANGQPTDWPAGNLSGGCLRLSAGDLDADGRPEIILGQSDSGNDVWLHTFTGDGTARPGWPFLWTYGDNQRVQLIVADLDRDGRNEIVAASSRRGIYVFRTDDSPFPGAWPVRPAYPGPPVVGDIDGDGAAEILLTGKVPATNGTEQYLNPMLLAYRADGTLARSWQLPGVEGNKPTTGGNVLVGDFDGDGQVDIAVNYGLIAADGDESSNFSVGGVLTVLRLNAPWRPHSGDWRVAFHDARNSATGFVPARLRIANVGSGVLMSWVHQPDSAVLQATDDLNLGSWITLPATTVTSNGLDWATVPSTNAHRWFRLQYR